MTHKLLFVLATLVVVSLVGCDKSNLPTSPTSTTPTGETPPLPASQCWDQTASNYGGPAPCTYSQGEARIGWVGFRINPTSNGGMGTGVGILVSPFNYSGKVVARIALDGADTHQVRLALLTRANRLISRSPVVIMSQNGEISLPHDGTECLAMIENAGTVSFAGSASFVYRKE